MAREVIKKKVADLPVVPNMVDYEQAQAKFRWEAAAEEPQGLPGGRGLNMAHEAVDRHAYGSVQARDSPLLPGNKDRYERGCGLA